jgi:hypothetical protein
MLSRSTWRYIRPASCAPAQPASAASTLRAAPFPRAWGSVAIPNTPAQPVSATARPIEPPETLRPRPLVVLHPVIDGLERLAVEPAHPLAAFITHLHQPTSRSTRQCLDTSGCARPTSSTRSFTASEFVHRQRDRPGPPPGLDKTLANANRCGKVPGSPATPSRLSISLNRVVDRAVGAFACAVARATGSRHDA